MKKLITLIITALVASLVFAVSYTDNTYQKLAQEYTAKAQKALDAGEYDLAEDYATKAQENAALSDAYVKKMTEKADADKNIALAKNRIEYVKSIRGDTNFPLAFQSAQNFFTQANDAYGKEDYVGASAAAQQVLTVLVAVKEITPLPKFYIVRPWAETKDCFWNISGRPYVYNNPLLWENLYQANKDELPQPNNPNLILPGMKMEIPSLTGEYRDGVYSPDTDYDAYSANR
jgi:nucleoid-associated protein YgaU